MKIEPKKPKTGGAKPAVYGRLLESDKLFEQEIEFVSEAGAVGKDYDFFLGKITRSPIIKSRVTGRLYFLPWSDIIKLAVEAGLDKAE
jgi:hypothetical protein